MTKDDQIANLENKLALAAMENRALQAEKASEYHRAEKLKCQCGMLGRVIEVLRRNATEDAIAEAEKVFKQ